MRVHNLTDVATPALEGAGLVDVSIHIGSGVIVSPGAFADVQRTAGIDRFLKIGALFIGMETSEEYQRLKPPSKKLTLKTEDRVRVEDKVMTMEDREEPRQKHKPK